MAIYSGTPTVVAWWEAGDRNGKRVNVTKILDIDISSQGGGTNTIGAAALGFSSIDYVIPTNYTDGSSQNRAILLWTDGDYVYTGDPQVAADADRGEPLDMSGDLTFLIAGTPA